MFPKNVPKELSVTKRTGPANAPVKQGSAVMGRDVFPPVVPLVMFVTKRNCVSVAGVIARPKVKIIVFAKIAGKLIFEAKISVVKSAPGVNTDPRVTASVFGNPVPKVKEEGRTGNVTAEQGAPIGRNYPATELIVSKKSVLREPNGMLLPNAVCL